MVVKNSKLCIDEATYQLKVQKENMHSIVKKTWSYIFGNSPALLKTNTLKIETTQNTLDVIIGLSNNLMNRKLGFKYLQKSLSRLAR